MQADPSSSSQSRPPSPPHFSESSPASDSLALGRRALGLESQSCSGQYSLIPLGPSIFPRPPPPVATPCLRLVWCRTPPFPSPRQSHTSFCCLVLAVFFLHASATVSVLTTWLSTSVPRPWNRPLRSGSWPQRSTLLRPPILPNPRSIPTTRSVALRRFF